ncbi:MAG: glycosyltransferase family 2 protein [Candidatus Undinarchaeales archaeon]|jgi:cellulose synthase/poly-beta-1,6-N-acetylglucosamine synthase-like glycosyltransferase|nr:glycosyltransferase family 2 protein [Candidatus Undinarchaeales archaeon]MDP7493762.1 glycosyltransferase family 2 protein [Candidatus Undinarchaeales archaeon]
MALLQQIAILEISILIAICTFWILLYFYLKAGSKKSPLPLDELPPITVIVPAHNEEGSIGRTLKHVLDADYPDKHVIVVNDGSTDGTAAQIALYADQVTLITHETNLGKAAGLNHAIADATTDIIITVDADSLIAPDSLRNIVRHFADSDVGAVAGCVKVHNNESIFQRIQDLEYLQCFFQREIQDMLNAVTITPGPLSAYRKDVLTALGGFKDDTLVEDFDMCIRIHRLGYRVRSDVESVVHTVAPGLSGWWRQRTRWFRGGIQLLRKHSDMVFNQDYSFLGMVMFPMAIFWLFVPVVAIPTIILNSLPEWALVEANLDILLSQGFMALLAAQVATASASLYTLGKLTLFKALSALSMVLGFVYIYLSIRVSRESLATYLVILPIIGLYSCLLLTVCLKSVVEELFVAKGSEW